MPGVSVVTEILPSRDGDVPTLVYRPDAPGRHPAVVLGMEATGITRFIRGLATDLAERGHVVAVPDYYRGGGPADPEDLSDIDEIMRHIGALSFVAATRDQHTAIDHIRGLDSVDPARVATWGFCTGATLSLLAACTRADLAGSVLFYPSQPWFAAIDDAHPVHPVDALWGASCPLLIVYGDQDPVMSPTQLNALSERLDRWHVAYEVLVCPGAGHAFSSDAGSFHHPVAAAAAKAAAFRFLDRVFV